MLEAGDHHLCIIQVAGDQPPKFEPCNDHHLLAARSPPPRVDFPHPELMKLDIPPDPQSSHPGSPRTWRTLDFKIFRLGPDHIANLKKRAKADPLTPMRESLASKL
ncbi:hypothetical protein MLD38_035801 [Melastoma candidum]|uniref:Uncharacterized protein n=1 Tax=Melastoma candidum TaxID=119954 RepID=A0ACB9LHQ7_9MYRT|nr:hypothetical protein MLD38_035801 [Melastoma candidum]